MHVFEGFNNLAGIRGPQALPEEWDMAKWCQKAVGTAKIVWLCGSEFYGRSSLNFVKVMEKFR